MVTHSDSKTHTPGSRIVCSTMDTNAISMYDVTTLQFLNEFKGKKGNLSLIYCRAVGSYLKEVGLI